MVLAAPDRDTAQWSADSLGRSEIEEVSEGFSYGANTIRDGVSLTPRRELRALALPSEIMRLANLEGYLKFPGPFPVASIRLKYVSRPKAAERFVPRKDDGAVADGDADRAIRAPEAGAAASPDDDVMTIPDAAEGAELGGDTVPGRAAAPEPVLLQGELDLPPRPGVAETPQAEAGEPANGGAGGDGRERNERPGSPRIGKDAARTANSDGSAGAGGTAASAPELAPAGEPLEDRRADDVPPEDAGEPQDPPAGGPESDGEDTADPAAGPRREWF